MTIQKSVNSILEQLEKSIMALSDDQYTKKIDTLSGASIGEHVRHVIELFVCLQEGYANGLVNYENRKRDTAIQTSRGVAVGLMRSINRSLFSDNKDMVLKAGYNENNNELFTLSTNYYREIAFNIEHAIHHMALIRIGITEVSDVQVPDGYGVASSTLKFRKKMFATR
jgi:hypothetical protein